MLSALRYFLVRQPVVFGVFSAALLVSVFFLAKFLLHFGAFHEHVARNQPLEPWMRPRYVAMSYHLPPEVLADILAIGPPPKDRTREPLTMAEIAAAQGVDLRELSDRVRRGAFAFHEGRGR